VLKKPSSTIESQSLSAPSQSSAVVIEVSQTEYMPVCSQVCRPTQVVIAELTKQLREKPSRAVVHSQEPLEGTHTSDPPWLWQVLPIGQQSRDPTMPVQPTR